MDQENRYHRQEILNGFGKQGQQLLSAAKVLVIGAGGLGCPVLQYLAASGVGTLGIVDDDLVNLTNLHRQVLFDESDVGKRKAEVAAQKLRAMNTAISIRACSQRVTPENVLGLFEGYDVVVDCTDNFPSRYLINDACVESELPLVWGAVSEFEGQVAVFNWLGSGNYRDLFPDMPAAGEVASCAEAGVLGVLPGVVGSMQGIEVIKLITGIGTPLVNQLLTYRALDNQFLILDYEPAKNDVAQVFGSRSYELVCGPTDIASNGSSNGAAHAGIQGATNSVAGANTHAGIQGATNSVAGANTHAGIQGATTPTQLDWEGFVQLMLEEDVTLIDVRDLHEEPEIRAFKHIRVPLYELDELLAEISHGKIIFVCQTGMRSMQASLLAADKGLQVFSLKGGIQSMSDRFETSPS
jgi:sulfur-carrier protein adenylyltransferase/sulfurtransferase